MAIFDRFFKEESSYAAEDLERASRAIDFSNHPYYKEFLDWLERESFKEIQVDENHMAMVKGAVRANTMREVREHLVSVVRRSESLMEDARREE